MRKSRFIECIRRKDKGPDKRTDEALQQLGFAYERMCILLWAMVRFTKTQKKGKERRAQNTLNQE